MTSSPVASFRPEPPDADWEVIRARVMARLADPEVPAWTDHNAADPGVTLAEAAAFALADLHYRAQSTTLADWPMAVPAWEAVDERSWHAGTPPTTAAAIAAALAGGIDPHRSAADVLEPLIRSAQCRDDARALLAGLLAEPEWTALTGLPVDAVIDLLRARLVRRIALESTAAVEQAVATSALAGGSVAQIDQRAVDDLVRDLPLWPDEVARLVQRQRRRLTAQAVAAAAADVRAVSDTSQWPAVQSLLAGAGLTSAEITAASALHPDPPGAMPETWEAAAGESTIWPPHALQALTSEPVTAADYARLARGAPGVRRAWAVPGQLPGVAWDGRPVAALSQRAGTVTLVVEAAEPPGNPTTFLRSVLRAAIGSEVDQPHPTWQDSLDPLDPRRMIGDEVGAALLQRCPVVVQGVLVADVGADRAALIAAVLTSIAEHFALGRPESRTTGGDGPPVDGPWPRVDQSGTGWRPGEAIRFTEVVQAMLTVPAVLGVEQLAISVSGGPPVQAAAGTVDIGPACVPFLAEDQCLRVRLALRGECSDG